MKGTEAAADLHTRLQDALADRYALEREIGRGAAAIVFLAQDLKHHRPVAVKVLIPSVAHTVSAKRFLREIEIAAGLQHPHILPVYDSGESGRLLYFVMPYVAGDSVRDRINRDAQLSVDETLRIASDVARALDFAHQHRVVHRDIKPENIMLSGGYAVVTDFGVARAVRHDDGEPLTGAGHAIGTPAYICPEQAGGAAALDGRCDIYSLGCVIFEMLAGYPPFRGPNTRSVLLKHLTQEPPNLAAVRADLPPQVARLILRTLHKEPTDRFATAGELADALTALRAVTLSERLRPPGPRRAPVPRSIAVLPFATSPPGEPHEYLGDGLADEIINGLSGIQGLRVASRTSAFALKGTMEDVRLLGARLNVDTVLEGTVRVAGDRIRIAAHLVDVSDGCQFWSETYDRELADVFAVQDEIARAIVQALHVTLGRADTESLVEPKTGNLRAYTLYLKGRHFWGQRTEASLRRGIDQFSQAIDEDPNYALAHAGLADSYSLLGWYRHLRPNEAFPATRSAAERALGLDDGLAEAHTALAYATFLYDWNWGEAEREFKRALALKPDYPTAHHWYGEYLMAMGRVEEAVLEMQHALALDPISLSINAGVGWAFYIARLYDDAIEQFHNALELDPQFVTLPRFLGSAYLQNGMYADALALYREWEKRTAGHVEVTAHLGYAYAMAGQSDRGRELLTELEVRAQETYVPADFLALVQLGLGEEERALDCLHRAVVERAWPLVYLKVDPTYDRLHGQARFADLIAKVGL